MWELQPSDEYERRFKQWTKKRPLESKALLANLARYQEALERAAKPAQIQAGFVHPEPLGVVAVDQKGGGSNLAESRLYVFPHEPTKTLYLLTIGDKNSQAKDIKWCKETVTELRKELTAEQAKHGEVRQEVQVRRSDDEGAGG